MQSPDASQAKPDNSPWIYALIGVMVAALLAGALFLFLGDDNGDGRRRARGPSRGAGIKQADWTIRVRAVRGPALPDKKGKVSKSRAKRLGLMIRRIYEAAYLRPQLLPEVTKRYMTAAAAGAVRRADPHIPPKADRVKTLRRFALIGVDTASRGRAAVRVNVVAVGDNEGKRFKAVTHDRLWLERSKGKWRVIAYNVNLKPVPLKQEKPKKGEEKKKKGEEKKPSKKRDSKPAGKRDPKKKRGRKDSPK